MSRLVAINDTGQRVGQDHGRATLSDHDVELILGLAEARDALIRECSVRDWSWRETERVLYAQQLSYNGIAQKFEVAKSTVYRICAGLRRAQYAVSWKRVES